MGKVWNTLRMVLHSNDIEISDTSKANQRRREIEKMCPICEILLETTIGNDSGSLKRLFMRFESCSTVEKRPQNATFLKICV